MTATVGEGKQARRVTTTVKIFDPTVPDIKLRKNELNQIFVGKNVKLRVKFGYGKTEWSSLDNSVATIDETGKLKAVGVGKVTITAKNNGRTITKVISVVNSDVK